MVQDLPVAGQSVPRTQTTSTGWLIRVYRLLIVVAAGWLIQQAAISHQRQLVGPAVTLDQAKQIYPNASRLGVQDLQTHSHLVYDQQNRVLGRVMRTSPQMDHLIGYQGPNDVLIGINETIDGIVLLESRDTEAHVRQIRESSPFFSQFRGKRVVDLTQQSIDGVSGSTLTAMAIVEAVRDRIGGSHQSLRFPEAIILADAQHFFADAKRLHPIAEHDNWFEIWNEQAKRIGQITRTSPLTDQRIGYQGPTDVLIALSADGMQLVGLQVRNSFETPEYYERVRDSEVYLSQLQQIPISRWQTIDLLNSEIEGVSGATMTSFVVAANIQQRLQNQPVEQSWIAKFWSNASLRRSFTFVLLLGLTLIWTFAPIPQKSRLRFWWQVLILTCYFFGVADLLSLSLLSGWFQEWSVSGLLTSSTALILVSLFIPWQTRQQVYCHQLCPHGIAQEWLSRRRLMRWTLSSTLNRWLSLLPWLLLVVAMLLLMIRPELDVSLLEPFDAWSVGTTAIVSFVVLAISLLISIPIPQAYCRFGCPTGAMLKFVRSHGRNDRWGNQETAALVVVLLMTSLYWTLSRQVIAETQFLSLSQSETIDLSGNGYKTDWTLTLSREFDKPGQLQQEIAELIDQHESQYSALRDDSQTSRFNNSKTTLEMEFEPEFIALLGQVQQDERWRTKVLKSSSKSDDWLDASQLTLYPEYSSLEKGESGWVLDWEEYLKSDARRQVEELLKQRGLKPADFKW